MDKNHQDPKELDLTKPRLASYKQKWKRHQDTVFWVDTQLAQRKGLKFYQTRCNAIILYTLPAYCISKVVVMESGEIIFQKFLCHLDHHRRFPCLIIGRKNCIQKVAGSSQDTQRIQPKPKTQLSRTERLVGRQESTKEIEKGILFDHEGIKHSTSTVRPVCGSESTKRCVLTPEHVEEAKTGTERPVFIDSESRRKCRKLRLHALSIPNYVIKERT